MSTAAWQTAWQYAIPQHLVSRIMGLVGNCKNTWVKDQFIAWFIRHYGVDMSEALQADPLQYASFNDFFTRVLRPDARPLAGGEGKIISPADGSISQLGAIQNQQIFQAKGFDYNLTQLLGGCEKRAQPFVNGQFMTVYLAPKDYHRVHMPIAGELEQMIYVPGKLFSVNTMTAESVPNLFARNERVVSLFQTELGPMAVILVGAIIVGSIHTKWAGQVAPPKGVQCWQYMKQSIKLGQGDEMGHFQMGSTVIVLLGNNRIHWDANLAANQTVRFGQQIGQKV